ERHLLAEAAVSDHTRSQGSSRQRLGHMPDVLLVERLGKLQRRINLPSFKQIFLERIEQIKRLVSQKVDVGDVRVNDVGVWNPGAGSEVQTLHLWPGVCAIAFLEMDPAKIHILVLERDAAGARAIRAILDPLGYQVSIAAGEPEALAIAEEKLFNLVVKSFDA